MTIAICIAIYIIGIPIVGIPIIGVLCARRDERQSQYKARESAINEIIHGLIIFYLGLTWPITLIAYLLSRIIYHKNE